MGVITNARPSASAEFGVDLDRYFADQQVPHTPYRGQMSEEFQLALADYHARVTELDCDFYHTIELPGGRVLPGAWDLRGHEATYLGNCNLDGQRVLEAGPASGWLSAYIARQCRELVVLDLPFGLGPELVPFPDVDIADAVVSGARSMGRLRNSWWFTKRALGFEATALYADIYQVPDDIGRFDVSIFGAILVHLSHPFRALQKIAAITDRTIVVTDVFSAPGAAKVSPDDPPGPAPMIWAPSPPPIGVVHWWALSPQVIRHMLAKLGFTQSTVTTHTPELMSSRPPMFTVVAHRPSTGAGPRSMTVREPESVVGPDGLPVPPPELRFSVSGTEDVGPFLNLGQTAFEALHATLNRARVAIEDLGRVLDFGSGVGRVTRHWKRWSQLEMHGSDIAPASIAWAQANLPFAQFRTNPLEGPLDYPDDYFGLIYSLSVFTHLPIDMQVPWFKELVRVLRPGGYLYFTTHGNFYRHLLDSTQLAAFDRGECVVTGEALPGSNVCAAFHPLDYVERAFIAPHGVSLVEFQPRGARGNPEQDSYLVRKALGPL